MYSLTGHISDPFKYLSRFITDSPNYAIYRRQFLDTYFQQRKASKGMSAITSSAIELYPHQLNVSSLVLHDHRLRYLLADEVGLGKTIEAGIIIRQFVLDNLHSRKTLNNSAEKYRTAMD